MEFAPANARLIEAFGALDQAKAGGAEFGQDVRQRSRIVVGFMGLAITQVRSGQHVAVHEEIPDARHPQRLEIGQVAGVLLGRPFVAWSGKQRFAGHPTQHLFEARWSAAQTHTEVRIALKGEGKFEFALKPRGNLSHVLGILRRRAGCPEKAWLPAYY